MQIRYDETNSYVTNIPLPQLGTGWFKEVRVLSGPGLKLFSLWSGVVHVILLELLGEREMNGESEATNHQIGAMKKRGPWLFRALGGLYYPVLYMGIYNKPS